MHQLLNLIKVFNNSLPEEVITLIISAIPVLELRGSIPYAIGILHMSKISALFYGVLGSLIPVIPILFVLEHLEPVLRKSKFFNNLLDKVFTRTRSKSKLIQEFELLGLIIFIGIPIPGTGVWTGTLAAYIFGLPKFMSIIAAFFGTLIAGFIMVFIMSIGG